MSSGASRHHDGPEPSLREVEGSPMPPDASATRRRRTLAEEVALGAPLPVRGRVAPRLRRCRIGRQFGVPMIRMWSSRDEDFTSFTLGRIHTHANWAFTAPGRYRLAVKASVSINGVRHTDQATYTFDVSDTLPTAEATSVSLRSSASAIVVGNPVVLDTSVTPKTAPGWVEFSDVSGDGVKSLGHTPVANGTASLEVSDLALGERQIVARYVPAVVNHHRASESPPLALRVPEEEGGYVFGIRANQETYQPGDRIELRVVGVTPEPGQTFMWRIWTANRPDSHNLLHALGQSPSSVTLGASQGLNGARIQVALLPAGSVAPLGAIMKDEIILDVEGIGSSTGEQISLSGLNDQYYFGDTAETTAPWPLARPPAECTDRRLLRWDRTGGRRPPTSRGPTRTSSRPPVRD
ncbi:TIGR03769 domain-containing protein [Plantactinospora sp. WMMC1484]|uniref:TIGR03769 domain-containing protein n=1 Tax=Plantactinospora sp. WMMC1484 TaxID=3404122 RepID=UPI003BF50AA8